jgi:hypothetical protein
MNYGEYRSAREKAKLNNRWANAWTIARSMPEGAEQEAALRDWWLHMWPVGVAADVTWGNLSTGEMSTSPFLFVNKAWGISCGLGLKQPMLDCSQFDLASLSRSFANKIVDQVLRDRMGDIELHHDLLLDVFADYQEAIKTSIGSSERKLCAKRIVIAIADHGRAFRWFDQLLVALGHSIAEDGPWLLLLLNALANSRAAWIGTSPQMCLSVYHSVFTEEVLTAYKDTFR